VSSADQFHLAAFRREEAGMAGIRLSAIITLALLAGYFGLRAAATACTGAQCDVYIPFSALLPALVLVAGAVTGGLAVAHARKASRRAWTWALAALTLLGVLGPLVSLAVLRDQPDTFVLVVSVLSVLVPIGALVYSVMPSPARAPNAP
jgi:heme/copper-type cytochrome/quinol oxidase subunit 3